MADPVRKRTEPPELRRSQILDAAKRRFRTVGFHATTMADVAGEAGISVGLIYRHFASKEALIEGIALEDLDCQEAAFTAVLDQNPRDIVAAFDAAARVIAPMLFDRERTALNLEITAEAARNPKIRAFAAAAQARTVALFRDRIAALRPSSISAEELEIRFQVLGGLTQGVAIQLALQDQPPSPLLLRVVEQTARLLMSPARAAE